MPGSCLAQTYLVKVMLICTKPCGFSWYIIWTCEGGR